MQIVGAAIQQDCAENSDDRTTFVLKVISDGNLCPVDNLDCDDKDILWKNFNLLASDGHALDLTSIPFPSVERSKKQFDIFIKRAEKILRRSPELNSNGDQVGERALGLFPEIKGTKPPAGVPHYKLFWRWGANFWEATGEHLEDVVALEQRLKEQGMSGKHDLPGKLNYFQVPRRELAVMCSVCVLADHTQSQTIEERSP